MLVSVDDAKAGRGLNFNSDRPMAHQKAQDIFKYLKDHKHPLLRALFRIRWLQLFAELTVNESDKYRNVSIFMNKNSRIPFTELISEVRDTKRLLESLDQALKLAQIDLKTLNTLDQESQESAFQGLQQDVTRDLVLSRIKLAEQYFRYVHAGFWPDQQDLDDEFRSAKYQLPVTDSEQKFYQTWFEKRGYHARSHQETKAYE